MSTDQMQALFSRVLPFAPLGDANNYLNVHWTYVSRRDQKVYWSGRACRTMDEMLHAVAFANRSDATRDVYFCVSSQRLAESKALGNSGQTFMAPIRNQSNAGQLMLLALDVDVKAGAYETREGALRALIGFVKAAGLPRFNALVNSGSGGMHVYWGLDTPISPAEWQPLANALAEATRRHGFQCDTACTVDSARILRVPGTLNRKKDPPKLVTIEHAALADRVPLAAMKAALAPYLQGNVVAFQPKGALMPAASMSAVAGMSAAAVSAANAALSAGVQKQSRPVKLDTVAPQCGFVQEALATGGQAYPYPLWHLTTLLSVFAEDGEAQAHAMAKGHPGYSHASTQALYEQKVKDRDQKNLGWPSCATIQNAGCKHCASCPHLPVGKSPLHLGQTAPLPMGAAPDLPPGYLRDGAGRVVKRVTDPTGASAMVLVSPYPLQDAWLQDYPWTLHFTTQLKDRGGDKMVSIAVADVNGQEMSKRLGGQGMAIARNETGKLQEFFVAWIKQLQEARGKVVSAPAFGWHHEGSRLAGFAYGGRLFTAAGALPTTSPDPELARQYLPRGSLDAWRKAVTVITEQQRPALDFILASAFAAPLVSFTGQNGCIASAYSRETGIGKTTALRVAQAVWGHPVKAGQSLDDTVKSTASKMSTTRSLPLYWDELRTQGDNDRFLQFVFRTTQGKDMSRLRSDSSQMGVSSWETMVLVASNTNLVDYASRQSRSTMAGVYRIYEFPVAPAQTQSRAVSEVTRIVSDLNENYGQAGLVYARYLGGNPAAISDFVNKVQHQFEKMLSITPDERFWLATVSCVYAGAALANKLGLTDFDLPRLTEFMRAQFNDLRTAAVQNASNMSNEDSIATLIADYIRSVRPSGYLATDRLSTFGPGRPKPLTVKSDTSKLASVIVHHAVESDLILFPLSHFKDWLWKEKYNPRLVLDVLENKWSAKYLQRATLGSGTPFASPVLERVMVVHLNGVGVTPTGTGGSSD